MSVKGLVWLALPQGGDRVNAPFVPQGDHIYNVDVERDKEPRRAFVPAAESTLIKIWQRRETHHNAVAVNVMVLPTYIGSRRTLNGKLRIHSQRRICTRRTTYPSTRWSIRMPK
jgi:hypothetical protein